MTHLEACRDIISLTLGVPRERIGPETRRDDLPQWDSVGHLNLMLAVEESLSTKLEIAEMQQLDSVSALMEYFEKTCSSR